MGKARNLTGKPFSVRLSYDTINRVNMLAKAANMAPSVWVRNRIETDYESDEKLILMIKMFEMLGVKDIKDMSKLMNFYKTNIVEINEGEK